MRHFEEINAASSDGGGDFPETVDQALADAVNNHDWRKEFDQTCVYNS